MSAPLVVASVFAPSERNAHWYSLQKRFLARTTEVPFDYWVLLNGVNPEGFDPADVVVANPENAGHGEALTQLVARFREERREAYLLLDSDCFPVTPGWYGILRRDMARLCRTLAAPVRTENLDLFPHPCAFMILGDAVEDARIDFRTLAPTRNLLGVEVADVGGALQSMNDLLLPLLRTNAVNLHPLAAGIYHNLFYHHGAGSRAFEFRSIKRFGYYAHFAAGDPPEVVEQRLFRELTRDPERFIATLTGLEHGPRRRWASRLLQMLRRV